MKFTRKMLSVFLSVLTILSIMSTATSVFAAEYTENKVREEYFDSALSGYLKNIIDTDNAVKIAEKEKVEETVSEVKAASARKARASAPARNVYEKDSSNAVKEAISDLDIDHTRLTLDLGGGKNTAYLFSEPISFIDDDGELVYKDTNIETVTDENLISRGYTYQNGNNDYKTYFSSDSNKGVLIALKDGTEIKLSPDGSRTFGQSEKVTIDEKQKDVFTYPNAYGSDTLLRFLPQLNSVKDEIILERYNGKNSFEFILDIGTNTAAINSKGEIEIINSDRGIIQTFAAPFAYDAVGGEDATSEHYADCTYSLKKKSEGVYELSVNVPENFLTGKNTVYPVTIDPTTENVMVTNDAGIYSANADITYGSQITACVGKTSSSEYGKGRAMFFFRVPAEIKSYAKISSAKLWLRETTGRTATMYVRPYLNKEAWANTVTWNTQPAHYSTFSYPGKTDLTLARRNINSNSTDNASVPYWYAFDITNAVRAWTTGTNNKGLKFIAECEGADGDYLWRAFATKENSTSAYRPYAVISYANDTTPPTISSVSGNPTDWTKSNVTLKVTATDDVYGTSGVASYSFDNGSTWQTSNSKSFSKNQTVNIKVKDKAGNISAAKAVKITKIDKTGPAVSKVALSPSSWTNGSVKVTVTASDAGCGLHATAYSFDNGATWQANNYKKYTANNSNINVKVRDALGNVTTYVNNPAKIDKIDKVKPIVNSVSMTPDSWTNKEITLTVNATDDKSGVDSYSFDGGETWNTEKTKKVSSEDTLVVLVKDKAGNVSDEYTVTPLYDIDAPVIEKVVLSPTGWTKESVTLTVDAVDKGKSEIAYYSFDNGATWQTAKSKEFDNNQTVSIIVKDKAGNPSAVTNVQITNIDKVKPTAPNVYEENGVLYISAPTLNDAGGSPEHFMYRIGGDEQGNYIEIKDKMLELEVVRTYDVPVYAYVEDEAGNISDVSSFTVKSNLGEYTTSYTDIALGEGVFPVPFERTYSSNDGWFFSFNANIQPFANGYVFTDFSGEKHYYIKNSEDSYLSVDEDELTVNRDENRKVISFVLSYCAMTCTFDSDGRLTNVKTDYLDTDYTWGENSLTIDGGAVITFENGNPKNVAVTRTDNQGTSYSKSVEYNWLNGDLTAFTDVMGTIHSYDYTNGLLTNNDGETVAYSAEGRVKMISQPNGAFVKYTYNDTAASANEETPNNIGAVTVSDSKGVTDTWYYKDGITIASSLDSYSDEATYDPNNISNALTEDTAANVVYALKFVADESEDAAGDESSEETEAPLYDKHSDGSYTFYKYDGNDRVVESLEVENGKLTVTEDTTYEQAEAVAKSKTTTAYDSSDNIAEVVTLERSSENILVNTEKEAYTYYDSGEMQTSKSYTWVDSGWRIASQEQYNLNGKTVLSDEYDYKTEETKIRRNTYEYDDKDRQIKQVVQIKNGEAAFENQAETLTSYNAQGDITVNTVSQWIGNAWYQTGCEEHIYNDYGNNTQIIETVFKNTLNSETNLVETMQTQTITDYVYDVWNQPVRTTVQKDNETEVVANAQYDLFGRTTSVTEDGKTTAYTYDNMGNVLTVTNEDGVTTYAYDASGKIVSRTDPDGKQASYTYDNYGNTTCHRYNGYSFTYNTLGSILTAKTGEQVIASYTYSANTKQEVLNAGFGNGQNVSYTYDEDGRITETKFGEQTKYGYAYFDQKDVDGNVTKEWTELTDYVNNLKKIFEENKTIVNDLNGNVVYSVESVSKNEENADSFDGRITTIGNDIYTLVTEENKDIFKNNGAVAFEKSYHYSDTDELESTQTGSVQTSYGYNTEKLISLLTNTLNNVTKSYSYTYDKNGNIKSEIVVTSSQGEQGETVETTKTTHYTYDSKKQLVASENGSVRYTYSYDSRGNILSKKEYTVTLDGNNEKVYTETESNSYSYDETWKDKLTSYDGQTITYDASGNPLNYMGHNLSWTMGRQLASFDNISYTYDETGIRTSKTSNGATTRFYLNGTDIIEQTDGTTTLHFYYDSGNELIGFNYADNDYIYVKNQQGDITDITNSSGEVVASYAYDPWGKVLSITGSDIVVGNLNPFRYRGYYYDAETELYYLQSRYYDPEVCRFINCDDVNYIGITESEVSYNPFAYCENNPINYSDPTGNFVIYYDNLSKTQRAYEHLVYNYLVVLESLIRASKGSYIYGQGVGYVAKLKYGCKTLSYNGCEIIAMYNALIKLGKTKPIYDIIFDAETKGGLWLDGLFGTFPNYIGTYLKQLGIKTKKYYMAKTIDKNKKKGDIFIVVYNHTVAMLHAVMVEVISKNKIAVYNDYNTATKAIKYKSFLDMISQRGNYIVVAYKVG